MSDFTIETAEGRREVLRRMLLIREFDETVADLFADGDLPGFVHLYPGQEAVAVGTCASLAEEDYITSTHRGHGHCIAKGLDPNPMMAELFGKSAGYCRGKGGSMHIADVNSGMLGANGIVGAGAPIAAGAALTIAHRGEDRVALSFFGDASIAAGQVHEGINLAATWDLPAIFVLENNQYGEFQRWEDQHNLEDLSEAAAAYGIPGVSVDGMDVEAVAEAVEAARRRARDGEPTLITAETYRYHGHYEGDPQGYREPGEEERWRERDPIDTYAARLLEREELTHEQLGELEAEVRSTVESAVAFGREAATPESAEAYEDTFVEAVSTVDYFRERLASGTLSQ